MLAILADKIYFYLSQCWYFLRPRRKLGLVSFIILASLLVAVWFAGTSVAHAADIFTWEGIGTWFAGILLTIAGWFIKLTFFILKFIIEIAGYNGFIDSSAVIVGWVMVRDVTNMFFVIILLLIAFGTILGLEQYEWKKLLVKLLMAAVIVNFSRIISGIIIDVAQVVMITFVNGIAATAAGNLQNMFGVQEIMGLSTEAGGANGTGLTGSQAMLAGVAAITFGAMMMMTMLTFLFLLMARMVMLWILIVLSPFAFVLNVLPQTQKYAGQWWQEFGGNVVAGPVIAFFLWLSFVTVGAGNALQDISDKNGLPKERAKIGDYPKEESTGITKAMSWEKMANFAIAIGMLLAGAKMAQQLGAAGGSMMGKAGEFGKKVAMAASGIGAARWAGRGALRAGKGAGKLGLKAVDLGLTKVGLGTGDWKRRGRDIASWASYKTTERGWFGLPSRKSRTLVAGKRIETLFGTPNKVDLEKAPQDVRGLVSARDQAIAENNPERIKELTSELEGRGYGVEEDKETGQTQLKEAETGLGKRFGARLGLWFAPTAFREEYSKDKEARAKYAQEQLEHLVSTSKTPIGKEKTRAEAELIKLKATGQDIKARKIQEVLENMSETEKEIMKLREQGQSWGDIEKKGKYTDMDIFHAKRSDNSIQSAAKAGEIEKKLASEKELKKLEAIRELLQTQSGKARGSEATLVKANLEQLTFDYEQVKARLVANARDQVLISQNRFSEANNEQNTLNEQAEARMKKHSGGGDYVQSVAKTEAQLNRIKARKEQLAKEGKSEQQINDDDVLKVLERSLSEMQISNLGVHAAVADGNKAKILKAAGMDAAQSMDLTPAAIRQLQAQDLSELINDKVEATKAGLDKAMGRFIEIHGEQMAGAILEQKRKNNERAAGQGSLGRAGLYKLKDKGDGTFETVLTDADSSADQEYVSSRRTAGMSGSKITTVLGFSGSVDRDSTGNAVVKSEGSKEILVKLAAGITANQLGSVDEYVKGDLAQVLDNTDMPDLTDLLGRLKKEVGDKRGLKGLLKFALEKNRMKNAGKIREIEKLVGELGKEEKGTKVKETAAPKGPKGRLPSGSREIELEE